jgi:hypothetical protein
MPSRAYLLPLFAVPLVLAGCQRLNDERTVQLDPSEVHRIGYSAPRYSQKVTIQVSSPGVPVSAYLVREQDEQAAKEQMENRKAPADPLAAKDNAEEFTLEATVPSGTGYVLLLRTDKKATEVKVKVTGR